MATTNVSTTEAFENLRRAAAVCVNVTGPFCGEFFNFNNTWMLCSNVFQSVVTVFILVISFSRVVSHDLFKFYTVHLFGGLLLFCISQFALFFVSYTESYGMPIVDTSSYSWFTLTTKFFRFAAGFQYRVFINFLIVMTYYSYKSPLLYRKYFSERRWGRFFTFAQLFLATVSVLNVFVYASDLFENSFIFTIITITYIILQGTCLALSALVTIGLLLCVKAINDHSVSLLNVNTYANRQRLISVLIYNIPPAIMNLPEIPRVILATYFSLSLTGAQMLRHPLFPTFDVLSLMTDKFIEAMVVKESAIGIVVLLSAYVQSMPIQGNSIEANGGLRDVKSPVGYPFASRLLQVLRRFKRQNGGCCCCAPAAAPAPATPAPAPQCCCSCKPTTTYVIDYEPVMNCIMRYECVAVTQAPTIPPGLCTCGAPAPAPAPVPVVAPQPAPVCCQPTPNVPVAVAPSAGSGPQTICCPAAPPASVPINVPAPVNMIACPPANSAPVQQVCCCCQAPASVPAPAAQCPCASRWMGRQRRFRRSFFPPRRGFGGRRGPFLKKFNNNSCCRRCF